MIREIMRLFSFGKYLFRFQKDRGRMVYLVIGLGNPGKRYESTRHNVGFMVVEKLAAGWKIELKQKSFNALWGKGAVDGKNVLLAKPQTFMNLSGTAVRQLQSFFKTEFSNLIVIHDDLDLPFGSIRMKAGGGLPVIKDWHLSSLTWELPILFGCGWVSANQLTNPE